MSQKKLPADLSKVRKVEKMFRHNGQHISFYSPSSFCFFSKKHSIGKKICTKLPERAARDSSPCLVHLLEKNHDRNLKGRVELLVNWAQDWDGWAPSNL